MELEYGSNVETEAPTSANQKDFERIEKGRAVEGFSAGEEFRVLLSTSMIHDTYATSFQSAMLIRLVLDANRRSRHVQYIHIATIHAITVKHPGQ